jgi:hypothetical protein
MRTSGLVMEQNPVHWVSRCPVRWVGEYSVSYPRHKGQSRHETQTSLLRFSCLVPGESVVPMSAVLTLPKARTWEGILQPELCLCSLIECTALMELDVVWF